jgi:hypothetical protein
MRVDGVEPGAWSGERVAVHGEGELLRGAEARLRASGVRVRRLTSLSPPGIPRSTTVLLLADGAELPSQLRSVAAATAPGRRLRVIVLSAADAPTAGGSGPVDGEFDVAGLDPTALRLEWHNPYRIAARILLSRWPLHSGFDPVFGQTLHLLVAGFGPLSRALALHAMRIGVYADDPPVLTLVADSDAWERWIDAEHPMSRTFATLRCRAPSDLGLRDAPPPALLLVADTPMASGLETARDLIRRTSAVGGSPLLILAAEGDWAPGTLAEWDGQLVPVRALEMALSPEQLLGGLDDSLAEVIHEHYRDTSMAQGRDPSAAPSGLPWAQLADSYRAAARHQADHLRAKLAVTDCRAIPEDLVESFAFAPAEVERLAIIEHRRWAVERWLDGWRFGQERDNARKLHPQLISYAELSKAMKDLDRFAVRLVPALLARSGLGVVRRLIVGVQSLAPVTSLTALRGASMSVLQRLRARYPDRGLTIALDPTDAQARVFGSIAARDFDAGLYLLLPQPLASLLQDVDEQRRPEILRIVRCAERRIPLPEPGQTELWLNRRAAIRCTLGDAATAARPAESCSRKAVSIDGNGGIEWGFEF